MNALAATTQEPKPSLALIPADITDGLGAAALARAEEALEECRRMGDASTLHTASIEAQAFQLAHSRRRNKRAADCFARLKVLAEAQLGCLDIDLQDSRTPGMRRIPLEIDGIEVGDEERRSWRMLGMAHRRGMLADILDKLGDSDNGINTTNAVRMAHKAGVAWVPTSALQRAARKSGLSTPDLRRAGLPLPGEHSSDAVLPYPKACAVARQLGLDPSRLPTVPPSTADPQRNARRRAATTALRQKERAAAAQRAGGNVAEAFSLLRRCAQVLDPAEHDFSSRAAKAHIRSAYEHLRKAEDEIAQALGVL